MQLLRAASTKILPQASDSQDSLRLPARLLISVQILFPARHRLPYSYLNGASGGFRAPPLVLKE